VTSLFDLSYAQRKLKSKSKVSAQREGSARVQVEKHGSSAYLD